MIQGPAAPVPPGFDPNFLLSQITPIIRFVVTIGVLAVAGRWVLGRTVGEALAERIRQGSRRRRHWKGFGGEWVDAPGDAAAETARVAALEQQVTLLNSHVSELAERLDCAERMLAERRERTLGTGPHGNL